MEEGGESSDEAVLGHMKVDPGGLAVEGRDLAGTEDSSRSWSVIQV